MPSVTVFPLQSSKPSKQCDRHNERQHQQSHGQRRETRLTRRKIWLVYFRCGWILSLITTCTCSSYIHTCKNTCTWIDMDTFIIFNTSTHAVYMYIYIYSHICMMTHPIPLVKQLPTNINIHTHTHTLSHI